ncbi:MAG TPA: FAD-dependent thymidylate synthase [Candidatus Dormibacteraeota bacterium]|nr:FAD-dependent thymidylate synthase [Candidatus Dormibacteraeota bacterium]
MADASAPAGELTESEQDRVRRYCTNLDRRVFALRNLPEVVKGALFSRYSRTEKSLRRVLVDEFLQEPAAGLEGRVDAGRAEDFYQRVLVGYGDDSVAELAGAHVAVERVSNLAAKALEESRIGISPLEKSTRYVRFDRRGPDGRYPYHRGEELAHPAYRPALDALFDAYSELVGPLTERVREAHPVVAGESERAWRSATRAKALDLLRGLLPAATLTNLGLYGNGRAFEYLLTKLAASDLPECRGLAGELHTELAEVIPAFVRRALDERYGGPAAEYLAGARRRVAALARRAREPGAPGGAEVRLVEHEADAERKVVAAALFPHSDLPLAALGELDVDVDAVLRALLEGRGNRRHRAPRALEHVHYTFEITANFGAYRDLQRHRMLTQERQLLGTALGYDLPADLAGHGMDGRFRRAVEGAAVAHAAVEGALGPALAQYAVPLAFRLRWYFRASLREVYHLCELRTGPQGHPDYRYVAQEMFRRVQEVHPRLAAHARFVDLGPGDELERRASEGRIDRRLADLGG